MLNSVLEAEQGYQKRILAKTREFYYDVWNARFAEARTKKAIWQILTVNGKYYPVLGTFYEHTKPYDSERLKRYIDAVFDRFDDRLSRKVDD